METTLKLLTNVYVSADNRYALSVMRDLYPQVAENYKKVLEISDEEIAGSYLWNEIYYLIEDEKKKIKAKEISC